MSLKYAFISSMPNFLMLKNNAAVTNGFFFVHAARLLVLIVVNVK